MRAKELMQLGCMCGAVAIFCAIVSSDLVFGKGYGIWESNWEKRNDT